MTGAPQHARSARLVLGARVAMLLAAAALAVTGFVLALRDGSPAAVPAKQYACPMHPEVTAAARAQCPICKMDLELTGAPKPVPVPPEPAVPRADPLNGPDYGCPMHPGVSARAPGQCPHCKMDLEPIAAPKVAPVSIRSSKNSKYESGVPWLPETFPPAQPADPKASPPIGAVKRRVFIDDVRAAAWLDAPDRVAAVLYRDELVGLPARASGMFFRAAAPRIPLAVRLSEEPPAPWDASAALVRFVVEPRKTAKAGAEASSPRAPEPRSGDVGWLELPDTTRELLVFPQSALLRSSRGPYVLVPGADTHTFLRRQVEIGRILESHVVVLSGLREGDRIVVGNAFFLDADARLKSGLEPLAEVVP